MSVIFYFPPCNALSSINPTMLTPTMWLVLPMYLETKLLQDPTLVICPMIDLDLMDETTHVEEYLSVRKQS